MQDRVPRPKSRVKRRPVTASIGVVRANEGTPLTTVPTPLDSSHPDYCSPVRLTNRGHAIGGNCRLTMIRNPLVRDPQPRNSSVLRGGNNVVLPAPDRSALRQGVRPAGVDSPPTVSWAADRESESLPLSSGNLVAGLGSSQRTVWALAIAARTFGTYSKNAATRWGSGRCHDRRDCGKIQNSPAIRGVDQGPTPAPSSRGGDHLGRSSLAVVIAPVD
jgi:hypothetical protein